MNRFFRKIRHTTLWMMLVVMPIGVRIDPERPDEITISAHGGAGQVMSVIRNCEGTPVSSQRSSYQDLAGCIQFSHRTDGGTIIAMGLRSGALQSDFEVPETGYVYGTNRYADSNNYSYFNPYFAVEFPKVGIGLGYLSGQVPMVFGEESDNPAVSFHLRIGNYAKANFQVSLNENLPLASGGGYFNMGVDYPAGRTRLFTGLSAGFYDQPGLVQKISIPLSKKFDLDFSGRVGVADANIEGGLAVGLRLHVPVANSE